MHRNGFYLSKSALELLNCSTSLCEDEIEEIKKKALDLEWNKTNCVPVLTDISEV